MELEKRLMDFNGHRVLVFAPAQAAAPADDSLQSKTKAQLIALAEERGVEVGPRATKAKIIKALQESDDV